MLLNCGVGEDSWESLGLQVVKRVNPKGNQSWIFTGWTDAGKDWRQVEDRGWDGWIASPTRWTCIWASSRSWWWTGIPGLLQSMGSQRIRYDLVTELRGDRPKTVINAIPETKRANRKWEKQGGMWFRHKELRKSLWGGNNYTEMWKLRGYKKHKNTQRLQDRNSFLGVERSKGQAKDE